MFPEVVVGGGRAQEGVDDAKPLLQYSAADEAAAIAKVRPSTPEEGGETASGEEEEAAEIKRVLVDQVGGILIYVVYTEGCKIIKK